MARDDLSLGVEMGRLEIEPAKLNSSPKEDNPFHLSDHQEKKNIFTKPCTKNDRCLCSAPGKSKHVAISKKKPNRILKQPVLKLLQNNAHDCSVRDKCSLSNINPDIMSLCVLVDNCNQLRISGANEEILTTEQNNETQWWKTDVTNTRLSKDNAVGRSQAGTCSQQALNPPCDVTIDELASYFETLVHIPKKMSSMAEMMYI